MTICNPDGSEKTGVARVCSAYGNPFFFTGRRNDDETRWFDASKPAGKEWQQGLMQFRYRMYDVGLGRFIGRDPIGYADGMGLQGAYFVPKGVDPQGLEVSDKPDSNLMYEDELISMGEMTFKKTGETDFGKQQAVYEAMRAWKKNKCFTIFVHYVKGPDMVGQFAKHARDNNQKCTLSLYIGHTPAKAVACKDTDDGAIEEPAGSGKWVRIVPDTASVSEALGKQGSVKGTAEEGNAIITNPKFGIMGCNAKAFNEAIYNRNQFSGMVSLPNTPITGFQMSDWLHKNLPQINKNLDVLCRCFCNNKVTLHLYFGSGERRGGAKAASFNDWPKEP